MQHFITRFFSLSIFIFLFGCSSGVKKETAVVSESIINTDSAFYQAAEYAPMDAVWLLWPKMQHKNGLLNEQVTKTIIEALAPSVKIKLVVANDSLKQVALQTIPDSLFKNGTVELMSFNYNEFWARDFGPAFVINNKGEKAIADFMFDGWGYGDANSPHTITDEKLDENIAAYYKLPVLSSNLVTEGGDHEVNGLGDLILCEAVELQRNPNMRKEQIENECKRLLGIKRFIWMKQGVRDDDKSTNGPIDGPGNKKYYTVLTTNGHVDEYARFVNDSTIMLAWIDSLERTNPIEIETANRMEVNYNILKKATGHNGKHFNIIKIPMPYLVTATMQTGDTVYDILSTLTYTDGSKFPKGKKINVVAAASYCNFLIANNRVLVAKYYKPGMDKKIKLRDEEVQQILQKTFPGKTIIAIDALAINFGGGGIHCITINEPKAK